MEIRDISGVRLTGSNRLVGDEEPADAVPEEIFGVEIKRQAKRGCFSASRSARFPDLRFLCAPDCAGVDGTGCCNKVVFPPFGISRAVDVGLGIVSRETVTAGSLIFTANVGLHLPGAAALTEGSRAYDITFIDPRNKKVLFVVRPDAMVGSPAFFINAPPANGRVPPNVKFTQSVDTATSKFVIVVEALRDVQPDEELLIDNGADHVLHERFTLKSSIRVEGCVSNFRGLRCLFGKCGKGSSVLKGCFTCKIYCCDEHWETHKDKQRKPSKKKAKMEWSFMNAEDYKVVPPSLLR